MTAICFHVASFSVKSITFVMDECGVGIRITGPVKLAFPACKRLFYLAIITILRVKDWHWSDELFLLILLMAQKKALPDLFPVHPKGLFLKESGRKGRRLSRYLQDSFMKMAFRYQGPGSFRLTGNFRETSSCRSKVLLAVDHDTGGMFIV